jgi:hypothetical protein
MRAKELAWVLALGAACALGAGCAAVVIGGAAAAGAGTVAYIRGELRAVESAPLDRVWSASQAAMDDLQFAPTTKDKDGLSARLIARTASDKKVTINLAKQGDNVTEIRIRVGFFGDESVSRLVLEKIKLRL